MLTDRDLRYVRSGINVMTIEIEVLRAALNRLLDHVDELNGPTFDLPDELYWRVKKEDLYDPTRTPTDLTLGALGDDWSSIAAIGLGEKDAFGYALVWASTVLRAIGERSW